MRRGATPDYCLYISGYDLTSCTVWVTLAQYSSNLTLTGDRLDIEYDSNNDTSTIIFYLTQQETLALKSGNAEVQIRFIDSEGAAEATEIKRIPVLPVLNEDVIEYEGD